MEKIYLKPESQEILIKGDASEGHLDAFSYDPGSDENAKRLGSLFVVGHVHHPTDDLSYSVNLIAALAKREYYATPGIAPREAFSRTLKKVNEVVEDFFKHEGLAVNIGVFAIAGEQIFLSRLGKFKLLLARDNRVVDVFNNVDLFDKEHIEQKQFSSVISGKVSASDRLLAFYPNKPLAARERYLKDYLIKLSPAEFSDKLHEIKTGKADFACAAVHINLQKVTEIASAPSIQPQELKQPTIETAQSTATLVSKKHKPSENKREEKTPVGMPKLASSSLDQNMEPENKIEPVASIPTEMPRIISTEFSLGKKTAHWQTLLRRSGLLNLSKRNTAILVGVLAVIVAGGALLARGLWFTSAETKAVRAAVSRAQIALENAQASLSQEKTLEARQLLNTALGELAGIPEKEKNSKQVVDSTASITQALDGIDNAQETNPSLVYEVPSEFGNAALLSFGDSMFAGVNSVNGFHVVTIASGSVEKTYDVKEFAPTRLFAETKTWGAFDPSSGNLATLRSSNVNKYTISGAGSAIDANLYGDNLYVLSADGITKITDAALGKQDRLSWLTGDAALPADPTLMTIDGSIYVMSKDGTLSIYYRGKKTEQFSTGLAPKASNLLTTSADSPFLYLADRELNRIYEIDKKAGTLTKTLKISGNNKINDVAVDSKGAVFFLTKDNKVWKILD